MFRLGQLAEHTDLIKSARCQYFVNKYEIFWSLHHLTTFPAVLDTHFIRISQFWDKAIFDPKTPDLGFFQEKFSMAPCLSCQWAHFQKQYKNTY